MHTSLALRRSLPRLITAVLAALCLLQGAAFPLARAAPPASWQPIGPGALDVTSVAAAHSTLYVATRTAGAFRSDDGGRTWAAFGTGLPHNGAIDWLGVDPRQSATVLALSDGIAFLSRDGARHWQQAPGLPAYASFTTGLMSTTGQSVMFVGGAGALFRSQDDGNHWQRLTNGLPTAGRFTFVASSPANGALLAGISSRYTHGGRVFRSTDGGDSWHAMDHGLPTDTVPWQGVWSNKQPATAWVAAGSVYRTDDAGAHWRRDAFGLPVHPFIGALTRLDDDTLFLSAGNALYRHPSDATAWVAVTVPWPAGMQVHELIVDTNGGPLAASAGGLFSSDRQGIRWRDRGAGLPARSNVYALLEQVNSPTLYAGSDDTVWQLGPDGLWQATGPGLPVGANVRTLVALPGPPAHMLCATDYGIYVSTTAVDRWSIAAGPLAGRGTSALTYARGTDTVYAALADGGIYAAPATSLHWALLPASKRLGYIRTLVADQAGGWLLAGNVRSSDGGHSWHATGFDDVITALQLTTQPRVVLAGTAAQGLYRSMDSGAHWAHVQGSLPAAGNIAALAQRISGTKATVYAIVNGLLFSSGDAGLTWQIVPAQPAGAAFTSLLAMPGSSNRMAAGTAGMGVLVLGGLAPTASRPTATPTGIPGAWTPVATGTQVLGSTTNTPVDTTLPGPSTATPTSIATGTGTSMLAALSVVPEPRAQRLQLRHRYSKLSE